MRSAGVLVHSFSFFLEGVGALGIGRTLRVGEPVGRHDGWLGGMRERMGFGVGFGVGLGV
jgi:hypothetical protein